MKKFNNKDERVAPSRQPPREIRLHALIFGGTAQATTPLEASIPMATSLRGLKYPNASSE